jgi:aminoglycoside phosphotransferase (APT) family kinase protein
MAVMPEAEFDVTASLVRSLLREQHPDLADLLITRLGNGWDNELLRLGPDLVVRLPRRGVADALMVEEQRWLPALTAGLEVATSAPVRVGTPGAEYPWHWSVCRWIDGVSGLALPRTARSVAAVPLARFLARFHRPAPDDAPVSPVGRGGPLAARDGVVRERLRSLPGLPQAALLEVWERASVAPEWSEQPLWLHGDLHPANVVLGADGRLAGVVDFGDLCSGDPATDLATGWLMFDAVGRRRFREELDACRPVDAATWDRARGWAVSMGSALVASSDDAPEFLALGRETLEAVLEP